jgi:uncharacterized metal-binding protein
MSDPFVRKIIKEIDNCDVIENDLMQKADGSVIVYEFVSYDVKAMMTILEYPDRVVSLIGCTNKCVGILQELARKQDIKVALGHYIEFTEDFDAVVMETERQTHTLTDLLEEILIARGSLDRK